MDILVSISALEHWSYCPRQCGLIHVESVWDENLFTIRGLGAHERVDTPMSRTERGVRVERALPIWHESLGLVGKCDVVEFHGKPTHQIVPVEYKVGGHEHQKHASMQLCAQALCLESMFGLSVSEGALYFAKTKTRVRVSFDDTLRDSTLKAIEDVREMVQIGMLPPPVNDRRCPKCSLIDACMPGPVISAIKRRPALFATQGERELP